MPMYYIGRKSKPLEIITSSEFSFEIITSYEVSFEIITFAIITFYYYLILPVFEIITTYGKNLRNYYQILDSKLIIFEMIPRFHIYYIFWGTETHQQTTFQQRPFNKFISTKDISTSGHFNKCTIQQTSFQQATLQQEKKVNKRQFNKCQATFQQITNDISTISKYF